MSDQAKPQSTEFSALLNETRTFAPADAFRGRAVVNDPSIYETAAANPEDFWAGMARELEWIKPWDRVLEWNSPDAKWFTGGKLNASVNCVDRHIKTARLPR